MVRIVLALLLIVSTTGVRAEPGPMETFARLDGQWTGEGVIDLTNGRTTTMRCHGAYAKATASMDMRITCEYGRYKLGLTGSMKADASGSMSGTWSDSLLHVPGLLVGSATKDSVSAKVSALGITGRMDVSVAGAKQSIYLAPDTPGTGVKAIAVVLLKDDAGKVDATTKRRPRS